MKKNLDFAHGWFAIHFANHPYSRPYVGITSELEQRLEAHSQEKGFNRYSVLARGIRGADAQQIESTLLNHYKGKLSNQRNGTSAVDHSKDYIVYVLHK